MMRLNMREKSKVPHSAKRKVEFQPLVTFVLYTIMADPTAFYEPEEDELLASLAVPTYQNEGFDDYGRMQELERHAYEQSNAQEESQSLESVPEDVKRVRRVGD